MAIYPKKNKNVRKFYRGGRYPEGAVDSPMVGIGLQYRPTTAEAPNLDAVKYLDASLRNTDAKHEEEYKKRLIDRKAYIEKLNELNATPGAKGKMQADLNTAVDAYENILREDVDNIWKPEGIAAAKAVEAVLDPKNIERMKANAADIRFQYEQAAKNGTLNQRHIVSGMATVMDQAGNVKKIPVSQVGDAEKEGFRVLTNKEHYEAAQNFPGYDISGTDLAYYGGNLKNTDEILKDWSGRFSGIGYTTTDDGLVKETRNTEQINAIKQSIMQGMSEQDHDAMLSLYLQQNKGTFDNQKYKRWLNGVVDGIASGKRIYEQDYTTPTGGSGGGSGSKKGTEEEAGLGLPDLQKFSSVLFGERDNWFGWGTSKIGILTSGESSYATQKPVMEQLNGDVHKLSDEGGFTYEKNQLAPNGKYKQTPVFGDVRYLLIPESTGQEIIVKDGKTNTKSSEWSKGSVISPEFMGKLASEVKTDTAYNEKGNPYEYKYVVVSREDGVERRLLVEEVGKKVIAERDKEGELSGHIFMSDITLRESLAYLRGDYGKIPDEKRLAYNNGKLTGAGRSALMDVLSAEAQTAQQLSVEIQMNKRHPLNAQKMQQYAWAQAKKIVLENHLNGIKNTPQTTGLEQGYIDQIEAAYTGSGLQSKIHDAYYKKEVVPSMNLPKGSYTSNEGGNIGLR